MIKLNQLIWCKSEETNIALNSKSLIFKYTIYDETHDSLLGFSNTWVNKIRKKLKECCAN